MRKLTDGDWFDVPCPKCGGDVTFVAYVDERTDEYMDPERWDWPCGCTITPKRDQQAFDAANAILDMMEAIS